MVILCYALTGILTLLVSEKYVIVATLAIWAFATLPQTALAVAFSVVMNAVAGPEGRYALLSRRWAIFRPISSHSFSVCSSKKTKSARPPAT